MARTPTHLNVLDALRPVLPGLIVLLFSALLLTSPPSLAEEQAPKFTLRQLVALAQKHYPGIHAAEAQVDMMKAKAYRAKWGWVPQGRVKGLFAPAPDVRCLNVKRAPDGRIIRTEDEEICIQTTSTEVNSLDIAGVLARVEIELGMPLYTFDKLGAAKRAARAGVRAKQAQVQTVRDKVAMDVSRAYWGLVLARELLVTVKDGTKYLDDAIEKVDEELEEGEGDSTVTDLLRLKAAKSEIDARVLEATKLERISHAALGLLCGLTGRPFSVKDEYLDPLPGTLKPLPQYREATRRHRGDVRALRAAVQAAKAGLDLERARFFPDFLLVAMAGVGHTTSATDPKNAFYSNPFNFLGAGFGLALNWQFDQVQQYGKYKEARAQLTHARAKRAEAMLGIDLELQKAHISLREALDRLKVTRKGEKVARKWLTATSQNLAAGLAEPKELQDALLSFFQQRLRFLQAIFDVNTGWAELGRVVGMQPAQAEGPVK